MDENKKDRFYNVSFDLQPIQSEVVWENVLIPESMWAYSREQSAKSQMRQCYSDITDNTEDTPATNACEYALEVKDRFSPEKMYKKFVDSVLGFDSSILESEQSEDEIVEFE